MVCRGASPCIRGQMEGMHTPAAPEQIHPRVYGADTISRISLSKILDSSPCIRGRFLPDGPGYVYHRFIPVYTGQILNPSSKSVGWADRRFLPRLPTIKSVCIISFRYIFADNTFWSKTDGYKIHLLFRMYPKPANTSGHSPKRENPKRISDNSHKNRGCYRGTPLPFYAKIEKTGYQPAI